MKGSRRLLCAALALCFILGLFPVRARAATIVASGPCGAENETDLIWTLDETGLLTFRGSGAMQDYTYYNSTPWYTLRDAIKTITIPTGVTNIGSLAFCDLTGIREISIPDTVTAIGQAAFIRCSHLNTCSLPEGLKSIGDSAFYSCTSLTSLTIPNSVTSIESSAFSNNPNLTLTVYSGSEGEAYALNNSLRHVVSGQKNNVYVASGSCGSGENGNLIWTLDEEGNLVFRGSGAMQDYTYYNSTPWYTLRDAIKTITIPTGVTNIGALAFCDLTGIREISIPDTVTAIGQAAFIRCSHLNTCSLPEGLESIGDSAFYSCTSLTSLTIPNSVTSIESSAFSDNPNLTLTVYIDSYAETYCLLNNLRHNAIEYHAPDATGVEVTPESATIEVGQTTQLTAAVKPVNAKNTNVTWTSLTPSVASVDGTGLVAGLSAGEARIMATTEDGGFSDFCKVIVTPAIPVSGVTLDKSLLVLDVGGTGTLTAAIEPENASNKAVSWSSSAPSIVEVDENGVVTMKAAGSAVVTVTTEDGAFTASCTVSTPVSPTEIKLDLSSLTIYPGDTATLNASLLPENATSRTVRWTSSDPDIASVDQSGTVSAVKPGTSIVVANCADGGAFAMCMVTVEASGSVKFVKEVHE